ncbi:unnamed protein product [Danaus chrysippus]|uniref:(African queen) hypothetical protein n=1 Tax=Danaus chrysippus TaxID=151541 RepID=A0A8J2QNW2_9NEOP|nr:unnamed protein product [Danaus chrysippus]
MGKECAARTRQLLREPLDDAFIKSAISRVHRLAHPYYGMSFVKISPKSTVHFERGVPRIHPPRPPRSAPPRPRSSFPSASSIVPDTPHPQRPPRAAIRQSRAPSRLDASPRVESSFPQTFPIQKIGVVRNSSHSLCLKLSVKVFSKPI